MFLWMSVVIEIVNIVFRYVDAAYLSPNIQALRSLPWYAECVFRIGIVGIVYVVLLGVIAVLRKVKGDHVNVGLIAGILVSFVVIFSSYFLVRHLSTFTLTDVGGSDVKKEQVEPLAKTVVVYSNVDTSVVFRDALTGEKIEIGYITGGGSEKVKLNEDRWYIVESSGTLTMCPVSLLLEP